MALKGQLLELKNIGKYQFLLKIGIDDDSIPSSEPSVGQATADAEIDDSLSSDSPLVKIYECKLDLSDRLNPVSLPVGDLVKCIELYHQNINPTTLQAEEADMWKIGYIADVIISELLAADTTEVIYGDEWEAYPDIDEMIDSTKPSENMPSPHALQLGRKLPPVCCPDCGVEIKKTPVNEPDCNGAKNYSCHVCGRFFNG
jgi:hypothetical protein